MKKLLFFTIFLLLTLTGFSQLYINEIMSNNQTVIVDDGNKYSDWIEIFNAGPTAINLHGYYLSDNADSLTKWKIPSFNLDVDSFKTIWCSGKNDTSGNNIHTNFTIDSQGETIFLSDSFGNVVDNVSGVFLVADHTYGRLPDGSATLFYLQQPTHQSTNNTTVAVTGLINDAPDFDISGGFYAVDQNISLSHIDPTVTIRYTIDGSDPTEDSPLYTGPITVTSRVGEPNYYSNIRTCYNVHHFLPDWNMPVHEVFKCSVIRARAFKSGYFDSPISTQTYFVDPNMAGRYGNLPVISLVSDPKNLFNDTTGIYVPGIHYQPSTYFANYYLDWDKPANIEMYMPDGSQAFNGNFKISINGQSSPSSPQKGLNVTASGDYGPEKIDYPLFQNCSGKAKYIQKFDKIKLRAWGSDRKKTLFRDAFCATIFSKTDLDYEEYQPVVVFIDGEYWGLQEMRERNRNSEYYESHYYIDKKNPGVDILDGSGNTIIEGDATHWDSMMNFINTNSLGVPANYDYVKTQMNVNSFMLNFMSSIFFARGDWPDQNEAKWRAHTSGAMWKWIQWDMDNTADYYLSPWYDMYNLVMYGSRGYGPSNLFDSLLLSAEFKNNFINLSADYMNTEFLPAITQAKVNQMKNELLPYFTEFMDRWQVNYNWTTKTDSMIWWLSQRPHYIKQQIVSTFGSAGTALLTIDVSDTGMGNVQVNTILLDNNTTRTTANTYPWAGDYFIGVPVPLTAIAKPGYMFVKWLPTNDTEQTIFLNAIGDTSLTAVFAVDPNYHAVAWPVINEVMSANLSTITDNYGEYDDWLEIYNPNNDTLDIGGYYLSDNLVMPTRFAIAAGNDSTKIPPHGFLLIWIDNDIDQGILHSNFKFNAGGDFIALVAPDGETVVDSISIPALPDDVSFGRVYDAGPGFINFNASTPNASNQIFWNEHLLINEVSVTNLTVVQDNYGQYAPWIEIFNPSADTIDLAGWKITNDPTNTTNYTFLSGNDSTKIYPLGFKLVWADTETNQGVLHVDFNIAQGGCVSLYNPNDSFEDSVCYGTLGPNESYGRISDGNSTWQIFTIPTPDSNNVDLTIISGLPGSSGNYLHVYPNPVSGNRIFFSKSVTFDLYDVLGKKMLHGDSANHVDLTAFVPGIYFLQTTKGECVKIVKQ